MAGLNKRSITVTISDASDPVKTFVVDMWATYSPAWGGYTETRIKDKNGDDAGLPPKKGDAQPSTITIGGIELIDAGDHATEMTLADLIQRTGMFVDSSWVSTTDVPGTCTNGVKTLKTTVAIEDCGVTKSYEVNHCTFTGSPEASETGMTSDLVINTPDPYPTYI